MYNVAFVNLTDKIIIAAEEYEDIRDAANRAQAFAIQRDAEEAGLGGYGGPAKKFEAYGPAETPFAFPVENAPES